MPWWGHVLVALVFTHLTIAAVTIYLHRNQAHRAVDLHPVVSHFFRLWLWLSTGMNTREWTAVHRKHHAAVETLEDPHSPVAHGIKKVLTEGAELYRINAKRQDIIDQYGYGTPDDWVERHFYTGRDSLGIFIMMGVNILLFGPLGLTIWAVQMAWIPIFAAGVINGIGHYWGYRNFQPEDTSTNCLPAARESPMKAASSSRWLVSRPQPSGAIRLLPTLITARFQAGKREEALIIDACLAERYSRVA